MTIANSQIVTGATVYSVSGTSVVAIGTATTNGSISISITSDPCS